MVLELLDWAGYLSCGCHGTATEHSCESEDIPEDEWEEEPYEWS